MLNVNSPQRVGNPYAFLDRNRTRDAIQNPDICWDEIQSSLDAMIDFSNPQIDRHIIRKFVSKIVPNGRNHFRWYMNLDGKDTTTSHRSPTSYLPKV